VGQFRETLLLTILIPNRFIGEESASAPNQQKPGAIRPRFGMTISAMIQTDPGFDYPHYTL
jgi:hypothetical protein